MAYTPTQWVNGQPPALNAENLNKIEAGIETAQSGVDDMTESIRIEINGTKKYYTEKLDGNMLEITTYEEKPQRKTLDDIAIGNVTYRQLFSTTYNKLGDVNFDNGTYAPATLNAGTPTISGEAYVTQPYSLKVYGTTSQQLKYSFQQIANHYYYIANKVKVDRYMNGWCGTIIGSSGPTLSEVNEDFETVSQIFTTGTTGITTAFMGSGSAANLDGYVDEIVIIDITTFFSDWTAEGIHDARLQMDSIYEEYLDIKTAPEKVGEKIYLKDSAKYDGILVGVVLDASSANDRFNAMGQLFDIARNVILTPSYEPTSTEYTYASKGVVTTLPFNAAMYHNQPISKLFAVDEDVQTAPASTTKVMSLITGMDYVTSIKDKVTLTTADIQGGSGNFFEAGDILTIEDLMLGMMLPSSNTCAMAFAKYCGKKILGSEDVTAQAAVNAFIAEMNKKANNLGMGNSVFDTPSGLNKTNKSTAGDMLKCTIEACSYPEILKVWNQKNYSIEVGGENARTVEIETTVTNAALENNYVIMGGKTGSLSYDDLTANALVMIARVK